MTPAVCVTYQHSPPAPTSSTSQSTTPQTTATLHSSKSPCLPHPQAVPHQVPHLVLVAVVQVVPHHKPLPLPHPPQKQQTQPKQLTRQKAKPPLQVLNNQPNQQNPHPQHLQIPHLPKLPVPPPVLLNPNHQQVNHFPKTSPDSPSSQMQRILLQESEEKSQVL